MIPLNLILNTAKHTHTKKPKIECGFYKGRRIQVIANIWANKNFLMLTIL
jgi:hypothetical protein